MAEKIAKYAAVGGVIAAVGAAIYLLTRKAKAEVPPTEVITFTIYLTNFPLELCAQYPSGWAVKWQGEYFGRWTPWYHGILVTTEVDTGAIIVYPGARTSPMWTFVDGGSYYFNWEEEMIYIIHEN